MLSKIILIQNAQIDVNRARGMLTRQRKHFWRRARLNGTDKLKMQRLNRRLQEAEYNLSAAHSWVEPPPKTVLEHLKETLSGPTVPPTEIADPTG